MEPFTTAQKSLAGSPSPWLGAGGAAGTDDGYLPRSTSRHSGGASGGLTLREACPTLDLTVDGELAGTGGYPAGLDCVSIGGLPTLAVLEPGSSQAHTRWLPGSRDRTRSSAVQWQLDELTSGIQRAGQTGERREDVPRRCAAS